MEATPSYPAYEEVVPSNILCVAYLHATIDWRLASFLMPITEVTPEMVHCVSGKIKVDPYRVRGRVLSLRSQIRPSLASDPTKPKLTIREQRELAKQLPIIVVERGVRKTTRIFPHNCNMIVATDDRNVEVKMAENSITITGARDELAVRNCIADLFEHLTELQSVIQQIQAAPDATRALIAQILELSRAPAHNRSVPTDLGTADFPVYTEEAIPEGYYSQPVLVEQLVCAEEHRAIAEVLCRFTDHERLHSETTAFMSEILEVAAIYTGDLSIASFNNVTTDMRYRLNFRPNLNKMAQLLKVVYPECVVSYDLALSNKLRLQVPYQRDSSVISTSKKKHNVDKYTTTVTAKGAVRQAAPGYLSKQAYDEFVAAVRRMYRCINLGPV